VNLLLCPLMFSFTKFPSPLHLGFLAGNKLESDTPPIKLEGFLTALFLKLSKLPTSPLTSISGFEDDPDGEIGSFSKLRAVF